MYSHLVFQGPIDSSPISSSKPVPTSNISLFTKPEYGKLVARLDLVDASDSLRGTGIAVNLFGFVMVGIDKSGVGANILNGSGNMVLLPKVVEIFVVWLPNTRSMWVEFKDINTSVSLSATQLVDAYENQLKDLTVDHSLSDMQKLPTRIETLNCPGIKRILSRVNLLSLESLNVRYEPTVGYSWDFFQSGDGIYRNFLVLPSHTNSNINEEDKETPSLIPAASEKQNIQQLQFPKLQNLYIKVPDKHNLDFEVDAISEHLSYFLKEKCRLN